MRWGLPGGSAADRRRWTEAHRWKAGLLFGFGWAALMTAWLAAWSWRPQALLAGLFAWPAATVAFAVGIRHRWGGRAEPDRSPTPTLRRPWSGAADWLLVLMIVIGAASAVSWAFGIIGYRGISGGHALFDLMNLLAAALLAGTAWSERRRRHLEPPPPPEEPSR